MLDETRSALRSAFLAGQLQVATVDPLTGILKRAPVSAVLQHRTSHKTLIHVLLSNGAFVACTIDHSLFQPSKGEGVIPVLAGALQVGSPVVVVDVNRVATAQVVSLSECPVEEYTYDLSVPLTENFVLTNGILAHNSYSIGGVSLDIEKSSKYESLKQNAESQFDKATEAKARTVKFIRGLQQPRFGMGIRSSFGPALSRGILSPRSFV